MPNAIPGIIPQAQLPQAGAVPSIQQTAPQPAQAAVAQANIPGLTPLPAQPQVPPPQAQAQQAQQGGIGELQTFLTAIQDPNKLIQLATTLGATTPAPSQDEILQLINSLSGGA